MLKRRVLLFSAILLILTNKVSAAWVTGMGVYTCETMLKEINEDREAGNEIFPIEVVYTTWIQGYLSALNYNWDSNKGEGFEEGWEISFTIKRCQSNPDQLVLEAVDAVWEEDL